MPRPLRNFIENGIYHLTARGVDQLTIFRDDVDRQRFVELVEKVVVERGWSCLGYCLMDNHYHLLMRTPTPDVAEGMQYLNGQFARFFNKRHGRTGHLFQGRYHHEAVETDVHLLETARYIPLNPVRAGMCATAGEWKWSSHNAVMGRAQAAWVDVEDLLARIAAFSGADPTTPAGYAEFVAAEERWAAAERRRRRGGRTPPKEARLLQGEPPQLPAAQAPRRRKRGKKPHGRR